MPTRSLTCPKIQHLLKLQRILYNLPFTALGALLPFLGHTAPPKPHISWQTWLWIAIAIFSARNSGMAFNELLDLPFDKKNPRTKNRALPSGLLTTKTTQSLAWGSLAVFLIACWKISPPCFLLAIPTAALIYLYAYTKRFTPACHLVLGIIQMLGPLMAFIAITGTLTAPPIALAVGVLCLLTGTDILYALQDLQFDRQQGLFSIPAALGEKRAIIIAKILHTLAIIAFLAVAPALPSPHIYIIGLAITAPILLFSDSHPTTPRSNTHVALMLTLSTLGSLVWHASS